MKLLSVIFLILTQISLSQENSIINDTTKSKININSLEDLLYKFDEFDFYTDLTEQKRAVILNKETAKLWLKASFDKFTNSPFEKDNDLTPGYLHSSLYEQYLENSKFNPVRTALGMIQAGAAGYLAYRHIKKYVLKK
jgi:hypothetical protein